MNILLMSYGKSFSFVKNFSFSNKTSHFNINLIGADTFPPKNMITFLKKSYKSPLTNSKGYLTFIIDIIEREKIQYILPFNDFDLEFLFKNYEFLIKKVQIISPPKSSILICSDKNKTKKFLKKNNLNYPAAISNKDFKKYKNIIIKGRGKINFKTKGFSKIKNKKKISVLQKKYNYDYILEEEIKGDEYTVDLISNKDNRNMIILPRKRLQIKNFVSSKSKVEINYKMIKQATFIAKKLKIFGFSNFQCFVETGTKKIIWYDLNPRISGGIDFFIQSYPKLFKYLISILRGEKKIKKNKIKNLNKILLNRNFLK